MTAIALPRLQGRRRRRKRRPMTLRERECVLMTCAQVFATAVNIAVAAMEIAHPWLLAPFFIGAQAVAVGLGAWVCRTRIWPVVANYICNGWTDE